MEIENDKIRYSVSKSSFFVKLAVIFMMLSVLCRFLGYWGFWSNQNSSFIIFQIALPILCSLLFVVLILYAGRRLFSLMFIPVLLGVMFFIIKAFGFDSILHTILCICLYLAVAFIYTATVFGVIRTKWLLAPLFGLPLIVHIYLDRDMIAPADKAVELSELLPEISVLCIMAALLCTCFAMKRRDFAAEKAGSVEQQTIDLLVSSEEPPEGEIVPDALSQGGDENE